MNLLQSAIEQGFVTTYSPPPIQSVLSEFREPCVSKQIVIVSKYPTRKYKPKIADPTRDTKGQLYFEDAKVYKWAPNGPFNQTHFEVARLYVPEGRIGIVRGCWQWFKIEGTTSDYLTFSPYEALFSENLAWRLRLSSGNIKGPKLSVPIANSVPGEGFWEIPNWTENRFPWGSNAPVFWQIPTDHTLRFWVSVAFDASVPLEVGGRLWGYTQPINRDAQINTRHGFQW